MNGVQEDGRTAATRPSGEAKVSSAPASLKTQEGAASSSSQKPVTQARADQTLTLPEKRDYIPLGRRTSPPPVTRLDDSGPD